VSSVDRIAEIRKEAEQALADSLPEGGVHGVTLVALVVDDDGALVGPIMSGPSVEIIESTGEFERQTMAVVLRTLADAWSPGI
jgi:hypothetical protein